MDRRTFITRAGRGGLLAALLVLAGILVSRKQVVLGEACTDDFQCNSCIKLGRCELPGATKSRNDGKEG